MATPETVTEPYWMGDLGGKIRLRDEFALRLAGIRTLFNHNDSPQKTDNTIKYIFDLADKLAAEAHRRIK